MTQAGRINIQISGGTIGSNKTLQQIGKKTVEKIPYTFLRIKINIVLLVT